MSQNTSYYLYQKYEKIGGQDWTPCYPNVYSISGDDITLYPLVVKSSADTECGYNSRPSPYITYRTISGTPYCSGYDKYVDVYYQESYDYGLTWDTISITPTLIEVQSTDCGYVPPAPTYLTFVALENGTFSFTPNNNNVISYSLDSGSTWTQGNSVSVSSGDVVMWKGEMTPRLTEGVGKFYSSGHFTAEGNVMSLLFDDNFEGQTSLSGKNNAFRELFYDCNKLTNAENLMLPATTLADYCYNSMFEGCTGLTTAPELPATTLANECYNSMFSNCTSLTTAPSLPATTLSDYCYNGMFYGCTSLTTAPSLLATTLAEGCYQEMFDSCTSLTTVPSDMLPSTSLAENCYVLMFYGCTSLTTAPSLPATTLSDSCYSHMFYGCTSLTTAPSLPATTLADYCYARMFSNCTSLSSITCLATDISASNCTLNWVKGVAASGTFTKAASMASWTSGDNGIPNGWTVQNA